MQRVSRARTHQRLQPAAIRRWAGRAIARRLGAGHDADACVFEVTYDKGTGDVLVHLNSTANAAAVIHDLAVRGHRARPEERTGYGVWLRVTATGAYPSPGPSRVSDHLRSLDVPQPGACLARAWAEGA